MFAGMFPKFFPLLWTWDVLLQMMGFHQCRKPNDLPLEKVGFSLHALQLDCVTLGAQVLVWKSLCVKAQGGGENENWGGSVLAVWSVQPLFYLSVPYKQMNPPQILH